MRNSLNSLLFLILFIYSSTAFSKKMSGYYVSIGNDTIKADFQIPTDFIDGKIMYENIQQTIKFEDSKGKKGKLKPNLAKEVCFIYNDQKIRMLAVVNTLGIVNNLLGDNSQFFVKLEQDGYLKLFKFTQATYNAIYTRYLFQKGNESLFEPNGDILFKSLAGYFRDCPQLSKRIENNVYTKKDFDIIVIDYNTKCK